MTENLNKRPRKSILKSSSSFDKPSTQAQAAAIDSTSAKCTKFDEMNIIETLHPADKDYGHMKIEEPKTPFRYLEENSETLDAEALKERISLMRNSPPRGVEAHDSEDSESEAEVEEDSEEARIFESKRKAHYNEYYAVKLARKLMEEDEEEQDPESAEKFIPAEELEIMEEET